MTKSRINLIGKWKVTVISGSKWFKLFFNSIPDQKIITSPWYGYNIMVGIPWGYFNIKYDKDIIILNYTKKPIIDKLRIIDENELQGDFFWKERYISTFSMIKENK